MFVHRAHARRHRRLRSLNWNLLPVPRIKTKTGRRAFSVAAPTLWNILPDNISNKTSLNFVATKTPICLISPMHPSFSAHQSSCWRPLCTALDYKKASSCIAQYPVLRTVQSALHFTSLTDLVTQTPSLLLWEASSNMLQLLREGCSYTYPTLSIARYSFIQLSELERCRVKQLAQGFNTVAQDSNPGYRSR